MQFSICIGGSRTRALARAQPPNVRMHAVYYNLHTLYTQSGHQKLHYAIATIIDSTDIVAYSRPDFALLFGVY